VICWPETYRKTEIDLETDEPVHVSGVLEVDEERWQIIADEVLALTEARQRSAQEVHFALRAEQVDEQRLRSLRETLECHSGNCPAFLHLLLSNRTETVIELEQKIAPTETMIDAVEGVIGAGTTSFQ